MSNFALRLQSSLLEEARMLAKDKPRKIVDRNLHHLLEREQRPESRAALRQERLLEPGK
jgi:hypothetical protein